MNYNRRPVNRRFFISCCASLLILIPAKGVLADGAYQRTEDRKKTLVWNNDPKPGDAASWSGDRDSEGYATGPGTLTWYRTQHAFMTGSNLPGSKKTPISSYTGTMVRGKLSGNVTTVDHGKSYHATFADGHRKGSWVAGPLITKAERVEEAAAPEKIERAEAATSTTTATESANANKAAAKTPEQTTDIPAQGPAEETTSEATEQKSEASKSAATKTLEPPKLKTQSSPPVIAQNSAAAPDESTTPREPVTKKAALAPGAVRAIERPTSTNVAKKAATPRAKVAETETAPDKLPKTAKTAPSQPTEANTQITKDVPAEGPPAATKEENAQHSTSNIQRPIAESSQPSTLNSQPSSKETPVDDSIRTLTGPPSSLHVNPPAETKTAAETKAPAETKPAPAQTTEAATTSASGPKLTAVQAMDIADIEARTKGFDLGEYQLPKAEYNAADDTWSVSYAARDDKTVKKLGVTIKDKTGKAEVNK